MDLWVCRDCHATAANGGDYGPDGRWYVDGSDTPTDRDPWSLPGTEQATDNTCTSHDGNAETTCSHCGETGYETGEDIFSCSPCDGCGSTLGGARYRYNIS